MDFVSILIKDECLDILRAAIDDNEVFHCIAHLVLPLKTQDLPSLLTICSFPMFISLLAISTILGMQNPPWHLPCPALVLLFTPSRLLAAILPFSACTTSASLTFSQRHTMCPYRGLARISSSCSFKLSSDRRTCLLLTGLNLSLADGWRSSRMISLTLSAMAGTDARPGA